MVWVILFTYSKSVPSIFLAHCTVPSELYFIIIPSIPLCLSNTISFPKSILFDECPPPTRYPLSIVSITEFKAPNPTIVLAH